jgi:hypothetical protein
MRVYTHVYTMDMALHIKTDSEFDKALEWLSSVEKRSKSDVVRDSVLARYRARKTGLEFGALRHLMRAEDTPASIARELKEMDADDDLD